MLHRRATGSGASAATTARGAKRAAWDATTDFTDFTPFTDFTRFTAFTPFTAGGADEFLKQAKRKFLGRVVQVRNLRSKFCLPLYTAPDGHKIRNLPALTPGELVQITEVRTSSDLSRVAGRTVLPNPDSPEDCLCVNLWSKFNLHGEQPRNGVWYVQRPS